MKFFIADAFTDTNFGGNPAGIVLLPPGASFPEDELMRKTAAELRYSETAFIRQMGAHEFNIRYFTPAAEVDLCGHATIAAFSALRYAGKLEGGCRCLNHTLSGDLNIEVGDDFVLMDMASPKKISTITEEEKLQELYTIMGLPDASDRTDLLPQLISTGLPDIMLPVASQDALKKLSPDMQALSDLSARYEVVGVHAFTLDAEEGVTAHARNFAPLYDIDEEAATGTSNGALTYYLYLNGILSGEETCRIIQGEKMDRPSAILTKIQAKDDICSIRVGGGAVILAEGEIHI